MLNVKKNGRCSVAIKANRTLNCFGFSLLNFNNEYVLVIGGKRQRPCRTAYGTVQRYNISSDRWDLLPSMNIGRTNHSCCLVGTTAYVIGGITFHKESIKAIEYLDLH